MRRGRPAALTGRTDRRAYGVDEVAEGVGVGVGGAVVGTIVGCGVTVWCGVGVRCADGVMDGAAERCGLRWEAGRGLGVGEGESEVVGCAAAAELLAVVGGLTHR